MNTPRYDIYSGHNCRDAVWLESIEGLASAGSRMRQLAAQLPGPYFLYSQQARAVLASLDTSRPREPRRLTPRAPFASQPSGAHRSA